MMQLLKEGQIWPGVHASEFAVRRRHLAEALPPGGIAVVPSAAKVFMTGQVPYTYRQAGPSSAVVALDGCIMHEACCVHKVVSERHIRQHARDLALTMSYPLKARSHVIQAIA